MKTEIIANPTKQCVWIMETKKEKDIKKSSYKIVLYFDTEEEAKEFAENILELKLE